MKKLLTDFFPLLAFFLAYKFYDVYVATSVLMIATVIQMIYFYIVFKKIEMMQIVTLVLIIIFGSFTLYFHDFSILQWKVTVINWLFCIVLIMSQIFMNKNIIQLLIGSNLSLKDNIWRNLNLLWAGFFFFEGLLNIVIMHLFSQDIWVLFKTFGLIGITIIFMIIQGLYIFKHVDKTNIT